MHGCSDLVRLKDLMTSQGIENNRINLAFPKIFKKKTNAELAYASSVVTNCSMINYMQRKHILVIITIFCVLAQGNPFCLFSVYCYRTTKELCEM